MDTNIQKYRALLKVVECGSFTRAAALLHYSQSAISRMINDLEQEWNITLLERSRTGVSLTSEGLTLLPFARSVCEQHRRLQEEVDALNGLQSGILRIGTFSSVATHWLPDIITAFQRDYPNIEFELLLGDYTEIETWIVEGRVDCGFTRLPAASPLETLFLQQDDYLAVLPADHPLTAYDRVPLAALCEQPFILLEKGNNDEISRLFSEHQRVPQVKFTLWDDYAIMAMVGKKLGVSILPTLIVNSVPAQVVTRPLDVFACRNIAFAFRDKKTASHAVKHFIHYLPHRQLSPGEGAVPDHA